MLERHVFHGRVTIARPVTVVAHDDDALVTWLAPGTDVALPLERVPPYTGTVVRSWRPPGMLQIVQPGNAYALALLRDPDDRFAGWYVNLQDPLRWTARGYDTRDNLLDLWRPVDGEWTWKDEQELAEAVRRGAVGEDEARGIHEAGRRAIDELQFPTGWETWTPPPDLHAPDLPTDWDREL